MALTRTANEITVREVLAKIEAEFAPVADAVENGEFALWVGSGISRQAPNLGNLIEKGEGDLIDNLLPGHLARFVFHTVCNFPCCVIHHTLLFGGNRRLGSIGAQPLIHLCARAMMSMKVGQVAVASLRDRHLQASALITDLAVRQPAVILALLIETPSF